MTHTGSTTHDIRLSAPKPDGTTAWDWQVIRDGDVIALGVAESESEAHRMAEAAEKRHSRPIASYS